MVIFINLFNLVRFLDTTITSGSGIAWNAWKLWVKIIQTFSTLLVRLNNLSICDSDMITLYLLIISKIKFYV